MKILLGNNTLDFLAGSETHTLTLALELKRLGHEVQAYSTQLGFIALELEKVGISCVSEFKKGGNVLKFQLEMQEDKSEFEPDVIFCNHYEITKTLRAKFPTTPIIATIHGILHKDPDSGVIWPEMPAVDANVSQFVAVSPEVQGLLKEVYNLDSEIIYNFFDLEKFKWTPSIEPKIKSILINTSYSGRDDKEVQIIKEVADHYNANLKAIGINFTPSWDLQNVIKDCDVVVGMGRSVLEGFCMGKIALVHGRWGTGGVLASDSYDLIRDYNFSGRNSKGALATAQQIIEMIDEALNPARLQFDWQQKVVLENHDVKKAAQHYLEIAERYVRQN